MDLISLAWGGNDPSGNKSADFPVRGGQYHWVAVIAWKRWVPLLSWITGWINTAGWVALSATAGLLGSTLILNIISLADPSYEPHRWHQFLIYIGFNLIAFLINAYLTRLLPLVTQGALYWSIAGWVVVAITILSCSSPNYQTADVVYGQFINETGWPDGLAWLLGLLQGAFGLTAFDVSLKRKPSCGRLLAIVLNSQY